MINLTSAVDDYLTTRRALGYKLEVHRLVLYPFVAHLATIGAETSPSTTHSAGQHNHPTPRYGLPPKSASSGCSPVT